MGSSSWVFDLNGARLKVPNSQSPKPKDQKPEFKLRIIAIIAGILIAAVGGVIAYRALFLDPSSAVVITNTDVRELPNMFRVVGGLALLLIGASVAFLAARRTSS